MPATFRIRLPHVGLLAACLASFFVALALSWYFITPAAVAGVRTEELMALLGLLVLPGLTFFAAMMDRRAHAAMIAPPPLEVAARPAAEAATPTRILGAHADRMIRLVPTRITARHHQPGRAHLHHRRAAPATHGPVAAGPMHHSEQG
ncbi:MAG: hypothetical protein H7Y88_11625 [Phycisphaerales bacterium]|nr:hypothetical protein [Phycisphaerales bacterium]